MATVYAVASAKGGVGKTTTTAAVATLLAGSGADVVAIDADIGMANLADAFGLDPSGTTIHDVLAGDASPTDAAHAGPAGVRVVPGETDLDAYAAADPSRLSDVVEAFDDADYVLMDAGAGLSHDSTLPLGIADESLLVSTPERSALGDTEKTRQLAERIGGHVAGAAITRVDSESGDAADDVVSGLLDTTVLARIPEDPAVGETSATNEPLVVAAPTAPATRAYRELTRALTGVDIEEPPEGDETEGEETEREETEGTKGADGEDEEADGEDGETDGEDGETDGEDGQADDDIIVAEGEEPPESEWDGKAVEGDREEAAGGSDTDDADDEKHVEAPTSKADSTTEVDDDPTGVGDDENDDEPAAVEDVSDDASTEPTSDGKATDDDSASADDDSASADDAASLMGGIPDAEDPDRESTANHEVGERRDDGADHAKADSRSPDTDENDGAADDNDELAGSVPFRDDDEGTVGTALSRSADDEGDDSGADSSDEDEGKGGFFSRLLGR